VQSSKLGQWAAKFGRPKAGGKIFGRRAGVNESRTKPSIVVNANRAAEKVRPVRRVARDERLAQQRRRQNAAISTQEMA